MTACRWTRLLDIWDSLSRMGMRCRQTPARPDAPRPHGPGRHPQTPAPPLEADRGGRGVRPLRAGSTRRRPAREVDHIAWQTSTRRERLPRNWDQLRAHTRDRAGGRCEATAHHPDCDGWGTDADHITPGDDHTPGNLQWLSPPCHQAKTAGEAADRNRERAAQRRRPNEQHPGRIAP